MDTLNSIKPKVFISYSWSSPNHEEWTINLATRLVSDGVDVALDKWSLKEGHDIYNFMESMVKSSDINKVLIILDKKYCDKADARSGGVGTETQIISPDVYRNLSEDKFIPIVTERDENGNAYIPTYLKARLYIDLSVEEHFEANYEKILRNIYSRPTLSKPKLGKPPSYLFEDSPKTYKTSYILRSFDSQVEKNSGKINSLVRDFLFEFVNNLKEFKIEFKVKETDLVGKQIFESLGLYLPLRDDYIDLIEKITKNNYSEIDIDIIIRFFEELPLLTAPDTQSGSWYTFEYDNYKFIIQELFLYTVSVALKNENYKFLKEILYSGYFIKERFTISKGASNFTYFYQSVQSFDSYYKSLYAAQFINPSADFMIKRIPENMTKEMFVNGDLLCHYVGLFQNLSWFPITYIYKDQYRGVFDLFDRLPSLRHFEKVKTLFDVNTITEFLSKIEKIKTEQSSTNQRYSYGRDAVRPLYQIVNVEKIGTMR